MKKGISLVALIITIIVLIILTAAVVITGANTPENAQLAVWKNDVSAVQDAVTLCMLNNMAAAATNVGMDFNTVKWVGVTADNTAPAVDHSKFLGDDVLAMLSGVVSTNYSVDENGIVYAMVAMPGTQDTIPVYNLLGATVIPSTVVE